MVEQNINSNGKVSNEDIEKLIEIINGINYGSVTVFLQDGKITQIEKNEKVRFK